VWGEITKIEYKNQKYQVYISYGYIHLNNQHTPCNSILVYASKSPFQVGEIHKIQGKIYTFTNARNEGSFDSASYYRSQKIDFYLTMTETTKLGETNQKFISYILMYKEKMIQIYEKCLNETSAGIIKGMVLGDKTTLDNDIKVLFTQSGISHILAISGLHVSVIGRSVYSFLRKRGCSFLMTGILVAILLLLYGILTGNGISTQRAIGMMFIYMFGQFLGRSYDMLNALGTMCLYLLWENPYLLEYSGFWFFVTALFGVGFVGDSFCKEMKGIEQSVFMSLAVTLSTLPVVAYCYYEVPLYSTIINFMIIPLLTPLFIFAILGGFIGIISISVANILFVPCEVLLWFYEMLCKIVQKLPFATIITGQPSLEKIIGYYLVLMGSVFVWKWKREQVESEEEKRKYYIKKQRKRNIILTIICFAIILYSSNKAFEISFLDVGQGDAIYICDGENQHFFIDGGSVDEKQVGTYRILPFLKSNAIKKISYWFVTHTDSDHISGLLEVLESGYEVETIVLPKVMENNKDDENYKRLVLAAEKNNTELLFMKKGDKIQTTELTLECIYPKEDSLGELIKDKNESSLVLMLTKGNIKGLFTGDISKETEQLLLKENIASEADIYKVAHHGSKYSNSEEFLQVIRPKIAVISCGENNSYGHPSMEAIEHIKEAGAEIYYTMKQGQITIIEEQEKYIVEPFISRK
ncbi:MAG: DNA internalization-related competence protein ComEC/Rec2, partial [Lachnospiraceae bacterium]|nr:DNA internalization-related competence protein ComEC/Rec2 [Lachnospiraceae bacterium]